MCSRRVLALLFSSALAAGCAAQGATSGPAGPHWSYSGDDGPSAWGDIAPAYAACKTGQTQSPIEIPAIVAKAELPAIAVDYGSLPLRIRNDGHTIKVEGAKDATLTLGTGADARWQLAQFHFHSPSEHTIAMQAFELEMHLVHKNAAGGTLVLAVLFKKGKESAALQAILDNAPATPSDVKEIPGVRVDPVELVPDPSTYVRYEGSLTAPPCTEGVSWVVLRTLAEASPAQIAKLRELLRVATNRPVQPLAGRQVLERQR